MVRPSDWLISTQTIDLDNWKPDDDSDWTNCRAAAAAAELPCKGGQALAWVS